MATKYYLAIADRLPHETNWSILFPAFPGVTSVAETFADVMRQAKVALASVVEDMKKPGSGRALLTAKSPPAATR